MWSTVRRYTISAGAFFERSNNIRPAEESTLNLYEVDDLLTELAQLSREEDQQAVLTKVAKRSTAQDLRLFVRLMKGDLRIQAGAKHVLDGLHAEAYEAFNASRNIGQVVERVLELWQLGRPRDQFSG
jgi:DNA ligase 3